MRVPKVSLRLLFVGAVALVALIQLTAVTLAALPPNRYSEAAAPHTGYLKLRHRFLLPVYDWVRFTIFRR